MSSKAGSEELSYEAARAELAEVVTKLESGGGTLEEALALWERGEQLAAICQARLDGARARLEAVMPARAKATSEGTAPEDAARSARS